MKSANATVHGAISIVNAIASGKGSALGISLKVSAKVEFIDGSGITFQPSGELRDDKLIRAVVTRAVPKQMLEQYHVRVNVNSEIPIGYGLKSSSAVSNAVSLACLKVVKENTDDLEAPTETTKELVVIGVYRLGSVRLLDNILVQKL